MGTGPRGTCAGRGKAAAALTRGQHPKTRAPGLRAAARPPGRRRSSALRAVKDPLAHNKGSKTAARERKTARQADKAPAGAWERSPLPPGKAEVHRPSRGDGPGGLASPLVTHPGKVPTCCPFTAFGLLSGCVWRVSVCSPPGPVCASSTCVARGRCAFLPSSLPVTGSPPWGHTHWQQSLHERDAQARTRGVCSGREISGTMCYTL